MYPYRVEHEASGRCPAALRGDLGTGDLMAGYSGAHALAGMHCEVTNASSGPWSRVYSLWTRASRSSPAGMLRMPGSLPANLSVPDYHSQVYDSHGFRACRRLSGHSD